MSNLTKREAQIVALIAEGNNNAQIAEKLGISAFTVGKHRNNISRKFDLHTTAQLVSFAVNQTAQEIQDLDKNDVTQVTIREREILRELARGRTSKEIARSLSISPRTVAKHIEHIKEKSPSKSLASLMKMWTSLSSNGEDT
jgi:DNA-binding CsgD family transcriptional regulator